ncbi:MAG: hypothetical protein M1823_005929 [Watsoniomyces obsoletus]|nr:MAG: hypothetical protein M1823_005929 [Watsoniomyces obsoletus]
MLQESFLASVLLPEGGKRTTSSSSSSSTSKDASIYLQSFRPIVGASTTYFKKSSTPRNGLAVSTTHIFAAQADKAVVHVYSRERGNQEATVPFPEKITSARFCGDDDNHHHGGGGAGVLMLGTEGGRIIAWEVCTGRQVSTPASHLQAVTTLAVDPGGQFLLSGSEDSNVHVWSVLSLLSFSSSDNLSTSLSPRHVLNRHQGPITKIVTGHSSSTSNIAISASKDESCIVWDYQSGQLLRTFLLAGPVISLALDPCDRAFYAGYQDGSIQLVDFFRDTPLAKHPLYDDPALTSTAIQASTSSVWAAQSLDLGATLCLDVVYEGNYILSGHHSGKVCVWDVSSGKYVKEVVDYGAPVTNLQMLPVTGFLNQSPPRLKVHQVVKPRYDPSFSGDDASVGLSKYTITAQFPSTLSRDDDDDGDMDPIEAALTGPSFPPGFLATSLAELTAYTSRYSTNGTVPDTVMVTGPETEALHEKVTELETSLEELRATHQETWKKMVEMRLEKIRMRRAEEARRREQVRLGGQAKRRKKIDNGAVAEDFDENGMEESPDEGSGDRQAAEEEEEDDDDDDMEEMKDDSSNRRQHDLDIQMKDQ